MLLLLSRSRILLDASAPNRSEVIRTVSGIRVRLARICRRGRGSSPFHENESRALGNTPLGFLWCLVLSSDVLDPDDRGVSERGVGVAEGFPEIDGVMFVALDAVFAVRIGFDMAVDFHAAQDGTRPEAILLEAMTVPQSFRDFAHGHVIRAARLEEFKYLGFLCVHSFTLSVLSAPRDES